MRVLRGTGFSLCAFVFAWHSFSLCAFVFAWHRLQPVCLCFCLAQFRPARLCVCVAQASACALLQERGLSPPVGATCQVFVLQRQGTASAVPNRCGNSGVLTPEAGHNVRPKHL